MPNDAAHRHHGRRDGARNGRLGLRDVGCAVIEAIIIGGGAVWLANTLHRGMRGAARTAKRAASAAGDAVRSAEARACVYQHDDEVTYDDGTRVEVRCRNCGKERRGVW